jgi:hypothetical protein
MPKRSRGLKLLAVARGRGGHCDGNDRFYVDWQLIDLCERATGKTPIYEADLREWLATPGAKLAIKKYEAEVTTWSEYEKRLRAFRKTHEYHTARSRIRTR